MVVWWLCVVVAVVAVSIDNDALTLWCFGNFLLYRSTAEKVVEEVRRQLKETPGIMTREVKPDYQRCVAIVTDAALKEMVMPGCLAVIMPVTVGLIFRALGKGVVVGVVVGCCCCCRCCCRCRCWFLFRILVLRHKYSHLFYFPF